MHGTVLPASRRYRGELRRRRGEADQASLVECAALAVTIRTAADMIELNPIRARIADLIGRLDALRGYL